MTTPVRMALVGLGSCLHTMFGPVLRLVDGLDVPTILVAKWKVEQQILHRLDAEVRQLLRTARRTRPAPRHVPTKLDAAAPHPIPTKSTIVSKRRQIENAVRTL